MMSSNVLLFSGRVFDVVSHHQILRSLALKKGSYTRGGGRNPPSPPAVPDSEKPALFRVKKTFLSKKIFLISRKLFLFWDHFLNQDKVFYRKDKKSSSAK